jgi:hypothetical protein
MNLNNNIIVVTVLAKYAPLSMEHLNPYRMAGIIWGLSGHVRETFPCSRKCCDT